MWKQDVNDTGRYARDIKKKGYQIMLPAAVKLWPTPNSSPVTASQTVEATLRLRKRNRKQSQLMEAVVDKMVPTAVKEVVKKNKGGGTLNPTWVEWLMGYPAGYTDLKDWAMLSSRGSRKKSAEQS
jgi:hypothetical protein